MTDEPNTLGADAEAEQAMAEHDDVASGNGRSTTPFPYSSLEDAEKVAAAVFEWGGRDIGQDRLASTLNTTVKSSGFRTDIASARTFGLIEGRGALSLTPLGRSIVDPQQVSAARVQAFKSVPLYREIFETHKGQVLPGPKGLESEMLRLGVAPKQTARARQLFQRSAQHAGFFDHSPERLVEPRTDTSTQGVTNDPRSDPKEREMSDTPHGLNEDVVVLITLLLSEGEGWPDDMVINYVSAARKLYKKIPLVPGR